MTKIIRAGLFIAYGLNCLSMGLFGLFPALFCFLFAVKVAR